MDIGTQAFSKEELNNIEKTLDPILSNKINSFLDIDEDHICDLITKYLDSNNDINWQDGTGNTLLHKAIYARYNIAVQLLLNKGIHTNISNLNLETALEFAYRLHYKVGAQLIEMYNCNEKLELSESIFEFNMEDENSDLETEDDLILNEPIVESNYPLHLAIKNNQLDKAIQLIENGADVNLRNPLNQTPLHCIMYHYNLQIAKMLIERGADVNAMDNFTQTPLFVLIVLTDDFCNFLDRCKLAHLLITNGADMDFICGWNEINVFDLGKKHFELTSNGEILHFLNHEKDMLNSKDIYLKKIWLSSSWGEYKEFVESMISPSFTQYNDYLFDKNKGVLDVQPIMNKASKRIVQKDGMELKNIHVQTPEICLAAVKQNGLALQFVKEQTKESIIVAIHENVKAVLFIKDKELLSLLDKYRKSMQQKYCDNNFANYIQMILSPDYLRENINYKNAICNMLYAINFSEQQQKDFFAYIRENFDKKVPTDKDETTIEQYHLQAHEHHVGLLQETDEDSNLYSKRIDVEIDLAINQFRRAIDLVGMERYKGFRNFPLKHVIIDTLMTNYSFTIEQAREAVNQIFSHGMKDDTRDLIREALKTMKEFKNDRDFFNYYDRVKNSKMANLKELEDHDESIPMPNASELLKKCEDLTESINMSESEQDRIFEKVDKEISADRLARLNESIFPGSMIKKSI